MSHDFLAHELAYEFSLLWINRLGRKPRLESDDKLERKVASFLLVKNILGKINDDIKNVQG